MLSNSGVFGIKTIGQKIIAFAGGIALFVVTAMGGVELYTISAEVSQPKLWVLGTALIVIAISIVIAVRFARSIQRPLAEVGDAVRDLASGDASGEIPGVTRQDEIGDVARSLQFIKTAGQRSKRIESALGQVDAFVMIADTDNVTVYLNRHRCLSGCRPMKRNSGRLCQTSTPMI